MGFGSKIGPDEADVRFAIGCFSWVVVLGIILTALWWVTSRPL